MLASRPPIAPPALGASTPALELAAPPQVVLAVPVAVPVAVPLARTDADAEACA